MVPEIGHFALILALLLSLVQATLPLIGAQYRIARWIALARPAAYGQFLFVALAFGCLASAFLNNDFSVLNVAANSNSQLPRIYRFAATWGSHEGSLLLWVFILALWCVAVSLFSRGLPEDMSARVLAVMGWISIGFLLFLLFTSNPFERLLPAATEGRDLNPLLQDPGMVLHPPVLYMGYVGFSVAFAFALSALISGRLDATWARWSRPWTTAAWVFLTLGIALGSWWAYKELGWGGWWFWDPVENASFMPWLVGTALIHSLAVTDKRGCLKSWTVLLAIIAFSLSLLGTFLVRSGVLTSVHAFATDPARGIFILTFLSLVIGVSLLLFAWRAAHIQPQGYFDWVSRESLLLGNNVLLLVAAATVLLGTLYPLFLDALGLGKISVGHPYFNAVFVPLMAPALFLMGIGPIARWRKSELPELKIRLRWAFGSSVLIALMLPLMLGHWSPLISLGFLLSAWIITTSLTNLWQQHALVRSGQQPRSFYGMHLAHLGIALFVIGVTVVKGYETEKDARLAVGDSATVAGYTFRFLDATQETGPNFVSTVGKFEITRQGSAPFLLYPEKRLYNASGMAMTEAAIDSGIDGDIYISMGEPLEDGAWSVRFYHKPFVTWIWAGCLLMALGGILAISDRRYRISLHQPDAVSSIPALVAENTHS
jgi:cytochrome c-type biogenesis protein CcmF